MRRPQRRLRNVLARSASQIGFRAAPREMQHAVDFARSKRGRNGGGQALRGARAIDFDDAQLDAAACKRFGEIAGAIPARQMQQHGVAGKSADGEARKILRIAVRGGDIGEARLARGLRSVSADREDREGAQFGEPGMRRDRAGRIRAGHHQRVPGRRAEIGVADRLDLQQGRDPHLMPARAQYGRRAVRIRFRPGDQQPHHLEQIPVTFEHSPHDAGNFCILVG